MFVARAALVYTPVYQAATAPAGSSTTLTVAWPSHAINDVAFLHIESANQAVSLSTPAGFTLAYEEGFGTAGATGATRLTIFWCRATSAAMTSPVIADPGDHVVGAMFTIRGINPTNAQPWSTIVTRQKAVLSSTSTWDPATVNESGSVVCLLTSSGHDQSGQTGGAITNASLSSITERYDDGIITSNGGHLFLATATFPGASGGSTGTSTATLTFGAVNDAVELTATMVISRR
jgi:hypothetical protein